MHPTPDVNIETDRLAAQTFTNPSKQAKKSETARPYSYRQMANQPYSNAFISAIAETLNAADVPCVLWGHCLLQSHGVPTIIAVSFWDN